MYDKGQHKGYAYSVKSERTSSQIELFEKHINKTLMKFVIVLYSKLAICKQRLGSIGIVPLVSLVCGELTMFSNVHRNFLYYPTRAWYWLGIICLIFAFPWFSNIKEGSAIFCNVYVVLCGMWHSWIYQIHQYMYYIHRKVMYFTNPNFYLRFMIWNQNFVKWVIKSI